MRFTGFVIVWLMSFAAQAQSGSCSSSGGAGSDALAQCRQASCQAQSKCSEAAHTTKSQVGQASSAVGQKYSGSANMSGSGMDLSNLTSNSAAAYSKAVSFCQQQKAELCDRKCDPSKDQKKSKELKDENEKCAQAISQITGPLEAGANDNQKASSQAKDSGQQSGGQQGGEQGDKGKNDQKSDQTKPDSNNAKSGDPAQQSKDAANKAQDPFGLAASADCSSPQAVADARCTNQLSGICKNPQQANSDLCKSFASHYCGAAGGGVSGGVVQAGDGVGKDFCQSLNTQRFCNDPSHPETASCPTCMKARGLAVSADTKGLPAICQTDPMRLQSVSAKSSMGADFGGGGGGSAATGGSSSTQPSADSAELDLDKKRKGQASGLREAAGGDMNVDGGGGGGSSGGNEASESFPASTFHGGSGSSGGHKDYPLPPLVSDVEKRFGRNVFSISSDVIRNRCQSGKLMHCGPPR